MIVSSAKIATITRTREYPQRSYPGFAWKWIYTVVISGEKYPFTGDTLSWARALAKRKNATKVIEVWKTS